MAELFKKEEAPVRSNLPRIEKGPMELHSALDTILRASQHSRLASESSRVGGERAVARADGDMVIASNVSKLRFEGELPKRFQGVLERL